MPVPRRLRAAHAAKELKEPPSAEYVRGELERLAEDMLLVIDQDAFANKIDD